MSYNTYMQIDAGGEWPATVCDIGNMTSNVSGMWAKALGFPLADMEGWDGARCIPALESAVSHIRSPEHRTAYREMEPSNGWGSVEGAAEYLERILAACREYPKAHLHISR